MGPVPDLTAPILDGVQCVVFDFDGVLVDSNAVKRAAYFEVFRDFPEARPLIERAVDEGEGDRYDVIRSVLSGMVDEGRISERNAGERALQERAERYNQICEAAVTLAPETSGCSATLRQLAGMFPLYINSATPEAPLRRIVERRAWAGFFKAVLGRPRTKVENLTLILEQERIPSGALAFVGDGSNDQMAAQACGCPFIAFSNGSTRFDPVPSTVITALAQLTLSLKIGGRDAR